MKNEVNESWAEGSSHDRKTEHIEETRIFKDVNVEQIALQNIVRSV